MNLFKKYFTVGIFNTLLHWTIFLTLTFILKKEQSISNLIAFIITITISYILNAQYTFKQEKKIKMYILYIFFMGGLSFSTGKLADFINLNEIITMIVFSGLSLVIGFFFSKHIIFKVK